MKLFEMEGFLRGKCLPGDMKVNETNAEYLVRKFTELEQKLAESQREFRAADATIENLQMQLEKLAAENAGLKAALRPSDIPSEWTDAFGDTAVIEHDSTGDNQGHSVSWSWVGNQEEVIKSVLLAVDKSIETPAADASLAEVLASGVDYAIGVIKDCANNLCPGGTGEAVQYAQEMVTPYLDSIHDKLADKSAQLRKGVQS
ncbi:hNH endonuclease [Enterobacter mori]|uniref:hNH endonuclease n=1 Tax=Enterobacter mori TaxID=539813 RepID=UPI000E7209E7|nr:hNH endonuclease [Enterobacter mori]KAA1063425.1 hNH endonuclease [Enterobacter mori]